MILPERAEPVLRRIAAVAAALAWLAAPVAAQSPKETRGAPAGQFDFYVLALSWSPGFCEASGDLKGREQCESGSGLGFVVHGLWPQFERGYPTYCEPSGRSPSRPALEETHSVFPDESLARHEWRKHGTCTGESPEMMAVACGRRVFQEIRICLDRDLRGFRQCPEVDRDGCRSGDITVPPVR